MSSKTLRNNIKSLPDQSPPPDVISVSSGSCADSDSVSSISKGDASLTHQRSIFPARVNQKYAQISNIRGPPTLITCTNPPPDTEFDEYVSYKVDRMNNIYEDALQYQEKPRNKLGNRLNLDKERFWGISSKSESDSYDCFSIVSTISTLMIRKTTSDSALMVKTAPSCLRSCKYSGKLKGDEPIKNCNHVTFASEVSVLKYNIPKERWVSAGWSSYFQ